jgi:hypothetical protein
VSNIDENGNLMYEDDPEEDQRLLDKKARKNRNKKNKKKIKQAAKLLESEQVVVENGQPTEPVPQPQPQPKEAAPLPPQTLKVPKPDETSGVKTSPTKKSKKERKRDKALQARGPEPFLEDDKDSSFEDLTALQKLFKANEIPPKSTVQCKKNTFAFSEKEKTLFCRPRVSDLDILA